MSKIFSSKRHNKIPIFSQYRYLKIIVWLLFVLPLILSSLLVYKGGYVIKTMHQHTQLLNKLSQQVSDQKNTVVDEKLIHFANDFITLFINVPINYEQQESYKQELQKYYAKNFYDQSNNILFYYQGVKRQLLDKQFYHIRHIKENIYDVSYIVTYQLSTIAKTDNLEMEAQRKQMLHIPLYIRNHKYNVVDFPYFTPVTNHHADYQGLENYTSAKLATIDHQLFRTFLVEFFKKYANQTKEDMAYMMKQPSSLNNERQFVELKNYQVFENGPNRLVVKALVLFKDNTFNDMNVETYTLNISQKDNKYFIDNLEHIR